MKMKKSLVLVMAAIIASLSLTGCGKDTASNTTGDIVADFAKDADKNIDMSKVEGTDATTADDGNAKGELGDSVVEITDGKVIKYNDRDVFIVSFKFKNKTGSNATFTSLFNVTAQQNEGQLPVEVVLGVDGVDCDTIAQVVPSGDTITVQKGYVLSNTSDPVTISVNEFSKIEGLDAVTKTFNLK